MQITVPLLTGKSKLLLSTGALGLLLIVGLGVFFLSREGTMDEKRNADLDSLVKILEAYHAQHGFYPQPAAREETIDGVKHVWGYRADTASLASCTVSQDEALQPDASLSFCGGDVYDARGKVIGWKGTLAISSGLNNVEVAVSGGGRMLSPLSEMLQTLPSDPAFALSPDLLASGFGEYIYAVRAPEDGATNKGGVQYQLAATLFDAVTGKSHTTIRGNYFVAQIDEDVLPPSLIGPGILLDTHGNPIPSAALHVLLDGQEEGFPNPLLGEGESILRLLTLQSHVERLKHEIESRATILAKFPEAGSKQELTDALPIIQEQLGEIRDASSTAIESGEDDLALLEAEVAEVTQSLEDFLVAFLQEKSDEVGTFLKAEVEEGERMSLILSGALLKVNVVEELVLLARDELIKYLDGEGIEEQSRDRAGRRIESALDGIPDLDELFFFHAEDLTLHHPFLPEDVQAEILTLSDASPSLETSSGALTSESVPMISTVAAELSILFEELRGILEGIEKDLATPATEIEAIDESLRKLGRALTSERTRIETLFGDLATKEEAKSILDAYTALLLTGDRVAAINAAAERSGEHANFAPFLFAITSLDTLTLERQVGVPDAEYKGIPYPLP